MKNIAFREGKEKRQVCHVLKITIITDNKKIRNSRFQRMPQCGGQAVLTGKAGVGIMKKNHVTDGSGVTTGNMVVDSRPSGQSVRKCRYFFVLLFIREG